MKKYLILIGAVSLLAGCKKFLDVNVNPNSPEASSVTSNYVFTNGINTATGIITGTMHSLGATWTGHLAHSTSFTGGGEEKTYQFTNSSFGGAGNTTIFEVTYNNLFDFQFVIDNGPNDGYPHLVGPAKVMQCLMYQKLVDVYGNIPYSEALKGVSASTPAYDDAKTIYESLITKLDEAIAEIKAATWPGSEPADIVFGGNKANWVKFANSLKMRILMRQSYMTGRDGYITTEINKIISEGSGFMTASHVTSNPGYLKQPGKLNLFYGTYGYNDQDNETGTYRFRKMNSVIIDWLKSSSDVFRLPRIAVPKVNGDPANPGDYVGIPLGGGGNAYLETLVSSVGSIQVVKGDATRRMIIMSTAEVYFLLAEAAQRYAIAGLGTAQSNYENGVREAFKLAAATHTSTATATAAAAVTAANSYLTGGVDNADWSVSTNKLKAILIQKWVAFSHIDGLEAWSDYRKSGGISCPTSPKSVAVSASQAEPVRLFYPIHEDQTNSKHVPSGIDVFTSKIFWDVN